MKFAFFVNSFFGGANLAFYISDPTPWLVNLIIGIFCSMCAIGMFLTEEF